MIRIDEKGEERGGTHRQIQVKSAISSPMDIVIGQKPKWSIKVAPTVLLLGGGVVKYGASMRRPVILCKRNKLWTLRWEGDGEEG